MANEEALLARVKAALAESDRRRVYGSAFRGAGGGDGDKLLCRRPGFGDLIGTADCRSLL